MNPEALDLYLRFLKNDNQEYVNAVNKMQAATDESPFDEDTNDSHSSDSLSLAPDVRDAIKSVVCEMILDGEIQIALTHATKQTNEGYSYDEEVAVLGVSEPDTYSLTWQDAKYGYVIKNDRPKNSW